MQFTSLILTSQPSVCVFIFGWVLFLVVLVQVYWKTVIPNKLGHCVKRKENNEITCKSFLTDIQLSTVQRQHI